MPTAPTKEELEANLQASIKAAEDPNPELDKDPEDEEVPPVVETAPEDESDEEEEETEELDDTEDDEEEDPTPPTPEPAKPLPPAEERLKESTKEAQKLAEDVKISQEALHEANNLPEPTEDELKTEFKDWETMDDTTRHLAKEALLNKRFREYVNKATEETRAFKAWQDKVETYLDNPETLVHVPALEGKQDAFKEYANDKSRRGVSLGILVSAFLHDMEVNKKPKIKGKMLETGSGGPNGSPKLKSDKLTVEQGMALRQSNYAKYKEYLIAGKIALPE